MDTWAGAGPSITPDRLASENVKDKEEERGRKKGEQKQGGGMRMEGKETEVKGKKEGRKQEKEEVWNRELGKRGREGKV